MAVSTHMVNGFQVEAVSFSHIESLHDVEFKYAEILQKAIDHKNANPFDVVSVDFAKYRLRSDIWVQTDLASPDYKKMSENPITGGKLFHTLISEAEGVGVNIRVVFMNGGDAAGVDDQDFLGNVGLGTTNLRRAIEWCNDGGDYTCTSSEQMHSKFIIAQMGANSVVYSSSSNMDEYSGDLPASPRAQFGIVVHNHTQLHASYSQYFQLLWDNWLDQSAFQNACEASSVSMRFDDGSFRADFFPVDRPKGFGVRYRDDGSTEFISQENPFANWIVMASCTQPASSNSIRMCQYLTGSTTGIDGFCTTGIAAMQEAFDKGAFVQSACHNLVSGNPSLTPIPTFDGAKQQGNAYTHSKLMLFDVPGTPQKKVVVSGSLNFKENGATRKSNDLITIYDPDGGFYSAALDFYNEVYNNPYP